jgi:hypothetical protein
MEPWVIALILKPLGVLFLFGCCALPFRFVVQKHMRDGRLKKLLLLRIHDRW